MKKTEFIREYDYADKYGTPAASPEAIALSKNIRRGNIISMDIDIAILREADIQATIGDILASDKIGTVVSEEVREFINKYMAQITKHLYDKYNREYQDEILAEIYALYEKQIFQPRLLFPSEYRNKNNTAYIVFAFGHARKTFDHEGLDIRAPMRTKILACADGEVVRVIKVDKGSYGRYIKIKHIFFGEVYYTYYAHLNEVTVNVGDFVTTGQHIGFSGNSGNSTGPHLHLTLVKEDDPSKVRGVNLRGVIDPENLLYVNDDSEIKVLFR